MAEHDAAMQEERERTATLERLQPFFTTAQERQVVQQIDTHVGANVQQQLLEFLAVQIESEEYAVDIKYIQEIVRVPVITTVPRVKAYVRGIFSLRGTIIPIVDIRHMIFHQPTPEAKSNRILIIRNHVEPVGFLLDAIDSVIRLDENALEVTPRSIRRPAADYVSQIGRDGQRLLLVLDIEMLLAQMETLV
jgi:purine-binding chemotaxis protein CheW